ncbi:hypothetical protein CRENBAI_024514 [Crenichthys baileyi]|uniref:Uncharacterized protein n=1 Tax=Crenichthys baileyi TaxID=28760 RepID=A0AAV9RTC5_9TELE
MLVSPVKARRGPPSDKQTVLNAQVLQHRKNIYVKVLQEDGSSVLSQLCHCLWWQHEVLQIQSVNKQNLILICFSFLPSGPFIERAIMSSRTSEAVWFQTEASDILEELGKELLLICINRICRGGLGIWQEWLLDAKFYANVPQRNQNYICPVSISPLAREHFLTECPRVLLEGRMSRLPS